MLDSKECPNIKRKVLQKYNCFLAVGAMVRICLPMQETQEM